MAIAAARKKGLKTRKPRAKLAKRTRKTKCFTSLDRYVIEECLNENVTQAERFRVQRWLANMVDNGYVRDDQAATVKKRAGETPDTHLVGSVNEMFSYLRRRESEKPNYEMYYGGRWYPVKLKANLYDTFFGPVLYMEAHVRIGHILHEFDWRMNDGAFVIDRTPTKKSIKDILGDFKLRASETPYEEYMKRIRSVEEVSKETGKQVMVIGAATMLVSNGWYNVLDTHPFGKDGPRRCVVEDEIEREQYENDKGDDIDDENVVKWPFLRLFSFDLKKYLYVDIDDIKEYVFQENAVDNLVLPDNMNSIIHKVFKASNDKLFGDTIAGRHGGLVILGTGGPGVGKTMTAEVFAEHAKRPLYSMEIGELGVQLATVEEKLGVIFRRASRWNAVLLLDEADVFMMKRGEDLERSAIVGVFLRLLDYFHGMLFLTTNRADSMDEAFKSRVTLRLDYPNLTDEIRLKIWQIMIAAAGMTVVRKDAFLGMDGYRPSLENDMSVFERLGKLTLNGRQVRNVVRLAKITDGTEVTVDRLVELSGYAAK